MAPEAPAPDPRRPSEAGRSPDRGAGRPKPALPPQAVMGLLDHVAATSLDADYAVVSRRRAARKDTAGPRPVDRLRSPHVAAMVVLALFGALVAVSAVQTSRDAPATASSRAALIKQVNAQKQHLSSRQAALVRLQRNIDDLQQGQLRSTAAGRSLQNRIDRLSVTTGAVAVTGPGIEVEVDDAAHPTSDKERVLDKDLQKLVNGLWQAGAEAIAVNGQRITSLTAIREAGQAITVNYRSLERPYVVTAIGKQNQLATRFVDTPGGRYWLDVHEIFHLKFRVTYPEGPLTVPADHRLDIRYAKPMRSAR